MGKNNGTAEDYEIGYGKPPKSGQFRKGVSGNPSGRPKKAADFDSQLIRAYNSPVVITENGRRTVITKSEATAMQLANKSASGNLPAARMGIKLRREAQDRLAERQQNLAKLQNRKARELTDEELDAIIRADPQVKAIIQASEEASDNHRGFKDEMSG